MYQIHYHYTTGSTFESDVPVYDKFELVFPTLEDAKAALKRMKEHHDWRCNVNSHWKDDGEPPEWWKPWPGNFKDSFCWRFPVVVDGKEEWLSASSYQGYFESLVSAEIKHITPEEDDMRFDVW